MTVKQAEDFVETWRLRLCPEWQVEIKEGVGPDNAPNDVYAFCEPKGDGMYLRAVIYLGETVSDKTDLDDSGRKRVLIHELLHLTLNDLDKAAGDVAKAGGQEKLAESLIEWQLERAVDRLAVSFSEFA